MNELHTRYSAASWLDYKRHIVIAGIGGAGRGIAHQLGVQGNHELYLCDPDIVESHNCIPQGYRFDDVGKSKVSACRDMIRDINYSSSVNTYWSKVQLFLAERHDQYNVIATTDTMESRRYLYNWWKATDMNGLLRQDFWQMYLKYILSERISLSYMKNICAHFLMIAK